MIDLLLCRLGRCPWRTPRESPARDWLADRLPYRAYAGLRAGGWDYNEWVGRVHAGRHGGAG